MVDLTKTAIIDGLWWPADDKGDALLGSLTLDPREGAKLALSGLPRSTDEWARRIQAASAPRQEPVFHGITKAGEKVSLLRCIKGKTSVGTFLHNKDVKPQLVVFDDHIEGIEQLCVREIAIKFPNMDLLLDIKPLFLSGDPLAPSRRPGRNHQGEDYRC